MVTKISIRQALVICLVVISAIGFLMPSGASAQTQILSYAAKFVCGPTTADIDVVRGVYLTAINIHNPQFFPVKFQKKVVQAKAEREQFGVISKKVTEQLEPDQAMFVDCVDIRLLFGAANLGHMEGFVVIEVPRQPPKPGAAAVLPALDVVGKYTVRPPTGYVSGIDIEAVPGRAITIP